jgi:HK97 family phage portal protein
MGILSRVVKALVQVDPSQFEWTPLGQLTGFRKDDPIGNVSKTQLLQFYRSWVRVAIDSIASRVAQIEFVLYKETGDKREEILDHPLLDLLYRPNSFQSKQDFFKYVESYKLLVGKSPVLKVKSKGNGRLNSRTNIAAPYDALRLLAPTAFDAEVSDDGELKGYVIKPGNGKQDIKYKIEQILLFKEFNPFDIFDGMSTVQTSLYAISTLNEIEQWEYKFFNGGAIPPFSVNYKDKLTKPQMVEVKDMIKASISGASNAFDPLVTSGDATIQRTGLTPKDIELSPMETAMRDKVLGLFGVPKAIVGIVEDVNRANMEASLITFMQNTIVPRMQALVDTLNQGLVGDFGEDLYLEFVNPVPSDAKLEAEVKKLSLNWLTQNEVRESEGLDAHPDGDQLMKVGGSAALSAAQEPDADESEEEKTQKREALIARIIKDLSGYMTKDLAIEDRDIKKKVWLARAVKVENVLVEDIQRYAKQLERRIMAKLTNLKSYNVKTSVQSVYNEKAETKRIMDILSSFYKFASQDAIDQLLAELGLDVGLDPSRRLQALLARLVAESALEISNTSANEIIGSLTDGLDAGEGIFELQERVKKFIKHLSDGRAYSIAQTETTRVTNASHYDTFKEIRIPYKEWFSLKDGRERDEHGQLDGQKVRTPEKFSVEGNEAEYPGSFGSARLDINCRCRILPSYSI